MKPKLHIILFFLIAVIFGCKNKTKKKKFVQLDNLTIILKKHGFIKNRDTLYYLSQDSLLIVPLRQKKGELVFIKKRILKQEKEIIKNILIKNNITDTIAYYHDGDNKNYGLELFTTTNKSNYYNELDSMNGLETIYQTINNFNNKKIIKKNSEFSTINIVLLKKDNGDTIHLSFFDKFIIWKNLVFHEKNKKTIVKNKISKDIYKNEIVINTLNLLENLPIKKLFIDEKYFLIIDNKKKSFLLKHNMPKKTFYNIINNKRNFHHIVID